MDSCVAQLSSLARLPSSTEPEQSECPAWVTPSIQALSGGTIPGQRLTWRKLQAPLPLPAGVPGVTWSAFLLNNLLPVTLGNIVAGALCMATTYSLAYGSLGKKVWKQ